MSSRTNNLTSTARRLKVGISGSLLVVLLFAASSSSLAQKKKKSPPGNSQPSLATQAAKARADVITATNAYKASLAPVLKLQEDDLRRAIEMLEKRRELLALNIIAKKELEESERAVSAAQAKIADTKRQLVEADNLIAEAKGEAQLAKLGPSRPGAYQATSALIRYNGPTSWVLTDAAKISGYFVSQFHHAMPISAYGQTAVHDQLGFDHRNAVDVAVSPDSAEGQTLMAYLRSVGIPFIAFRHAVAGSATGAHIHIGYPSRRVSK